MADNRVDRNQSATLWCGRLAPNADEELLWEVMTQAGPVRHIHMPRDRISGEHNGYAFVEFRTEQDCEYALRVMSSLRLFGQPIRINKAARDNAAESGAKLYVGNLDPDVDETLLHRAFGSFGTVVSAKVMYDEVGQPRGFGFVNFSDFEQADNAIMHMNGQFLAGKPVTVSYAFKKDGLQGERHGTDAERLLARAHKVAASNAEQTPLTFHQHTLFAGGANEGPQLGLGMQQRPPMMPMMGGMPPPPPGQIPTSMHMPPPPMPPAPAMGMPPPPMPPMGHMPPPPPVGMPRPPPPPGSMPPPPMPPGQPAPPMMH